DRPRPGDQHVLAEHGERQGGVDGVAERVEDGGHVAVDARLVVPDVGDRQGEVLGEGPGAVDADAASGGRQVPGARQAVAAAAADDVPLAADDVAGLEVVHVGAEGDDLADELVADHHGHGDGLPGPVVPLVDVDVGAADAGPVDADEHVV